MINLLPLVHPWSKAYHVCHQNFNLTGLNDCSPLVTALGRLSSQANNYICYTARIFARAVSNPAPLDYSFDGINDMPFTTLLPAQTAEWYTSESLLELYRTQVPRITVLMT